MQIRPVYSWPLIASLLSAMAGPSMADEGWAGTLGAGAIYAPDYLGSNDYETRVWPAISLSYGDRFYLNSLDGLGWNAFRQGNWLVSPFIGYTPGRDNDHDLSHLDKVDGGATAGLRVAYTNDSWTYSGDAQTPFTGDMDGYQLSLKARWQGQLSKHWSASIGPSLKYSSADWTEDMFGVSSRESARSGLAAYNPDDGYFSIALGSTLSYHLTPDWSVTAMASIAQLTGDAKDSPLVDSVGDKNQAYAGAFVSYRF
ncbi:MipA/OmpV family protein [Halopseudomonas pelagia]|uniref:MipA/OmpV family protein n=2 Tax=Halopseudomonas pelagia TaxID=553151 RepID=A0AA91U310_9GAMM|nr:structural protein MipA [Halopseudomonas pelagia]QFY56462.1 MipA/OmpV family protein [Halopseudomonas pelagia]